MRVLAQSLFIASSSYAVDESFGQNTVTFSLTTPEVDTNTLDFIHRPEYWLYDEPVALYGKNHRRKTVSTVSRKEILLSLMQHGRLTEFSGKNCNIKALIDHIKLRQNIVAWAGKVEWGWPDGEYAKWNKVFWNKSQPKNMAQPFNAFEDAFINQKKYSIGCYTAIKLTYVFGILDFYKRVNPNKKTYNELVRRVTADKWPLQVVEPPAMWSFEDDYDATQAEVPGKLLELTEDVGDKNFVPGDWVYFVNTDEKTKHKVGYEGSNSIYLGRGVFVDFYNDVEHRYTFEQKLFEVTQWKNHVFSQSRHYELAEFLNKQKLDGLARSTDGGGVVLSRRAVPNIYN